VRLRLRISKCENAADYSGGKRFRFAVIDLDRAKDYPANFVCMLPMHISSDGKVSNIFMRVFGDKSLEVAKKLLADALKKEADSDVKGEIERRLKLLEPRPLSEAVCVSCGKRFQKKPGRRFKQRFCQECLRKRFAGRK